VTLIRAAIRWIALAMLAMPTPRSDALDAGEAPPVVVALLSKETEPYRLTEKGLRGALAHHRTHLTTLLMGPDGPNRDALANAQIIIGVGTEAAAWLHRHASSQAEIVYCMVADPAGAGLDRGRPMHGVKGEISIHEQIAFLTATLPKARRIGILYRGDSRRGTAALEAFRAAAPSTWTIHALDAATAPSISAAVNSLMAGRPDVIWTMPDGALYEMATVRTLLNESIRAGVPVFGFSVAFVRAGATLGVGIEPEPHGRQAGELVLRIWQERRRRDAPLDTPIALEPRYQTAINLGVAEQLGVKIPEAARREADIVIGGGN
jgi:ABC-type uncharacterized transport system substrate-binding protein